MAASPCPADTHGFGAAADIVDFKIASEGEEVLFVVEGEGARCAGKGGGEG